jgi:hypothetical protein
MTLMNSYKVDKELLEIIGGFIVLIISLTIVLYSFMCYSKYCKNKDKKDDEKINRTELLFTWSGDLLVKYILI